jgi:transketolase
VIVHSHIAYSAPHAVDTAKAHGAPLGEEEVAAAKRALGWDPDKHFYIPDEVYSHLNRVDHGNAVETEWRASFDIWSQAFPDLREKWNAAHEGRIGEWTLPAFAAGEQVATRDAGKQVMQAFKDAVPTMIGGAADLVESTKTEFEGAGLFSAQWTGRNIPFGIREHAMGSIVNGISAHGGCVKPYGSTFLIFSDYMRPAVRLSALMQLPVLWVWTHDSVGLGEDGPTHQPVETYAALRAIPFLWFIRPADANETAEAWRVALERTDGPVALALSRQKTPTIDRSGTAPASMLDHGAYTLWESSSSPDLILIGTGVEVALALEAGRALADAGTAVRVVSMPCWELFEAQSAEYRDEVLPPDVRARLSIEPGVELGWSKWVGDRGSSISIEHYGASAPGGTVLSEFGYNLDNVVARASALLERVI